MHEVVGGELEAELGVEKAQAAVTRAQAMKARQDVKPLVIITQTDGSGFNGESP